MKKIFLAILLLSLPNLAQAKLNVVASTSDLAAIASEVGGELIEIKSIAKGDQDPHFLEAKPSYALMLNRADLLIVNGLDLESGWIPVLLTQARNGKIQPGNPGYLDASSRIHALEIPTGHIDRSMGDVHPDGNPHYWLNPDNAITISGEISDKLKSLDPSNSAAYQKNLDVFRHKIKDKMAQWYPQIQKLRGKKLITHHQSFSYFVDWADLRVMGMIEPKPGISPPPSHIASLLDLIQKENIGLIIAENYYDPKPARELGRKTGAKALILASSVGGAPGINTYTDLIDYLLKEISQ